MNKQLVIKMLITTGLILISALVVFAAVLFFTADDTMIKAFAAGIGAGAVIGGLIKFLIVIPKKYKEKDERYLMVTLLSSLISQTVFGFTSYIGLMFVMTRILIINEFNAGPILISVFIIISLTFTAEKIAYKFIDKRM